MRKLASIRKIDNIFSIPDADFIEGIQVGGWQMISKKGEFKIGDLAVYFEIDSILPDLPVFSFLNGNFRIKSKKMRGVVSQGLLIPMSALTDIFNSEWHWENRKNVVDRIEAKVLEAFGKQLVDLDEDESNQLSFWPAYHFCLGMESEISLQDGDDVTDLLLVNKWEPQESNSQGPNRVRVSSFPSHIVSKTDEERVQSSKALIDELTGKPYVITVKIDGQSISAGWKEDEFYVCSRNQRIKPIEGEPITSLFLKSVAKYDLENKLKDTGMWIQAEQYGPGIQKNRLNVSDVKIVVFNVIDVINNRHLNYDEAVAFCESIDVPFVPVEEVGESFNYTMEQLLEKADGVYPGGHLREGIVIRPQTVTPSRHGHNGRLSFKVVSNKFLLKVGE